MIISLSVHKSYMGDLAFFHLGRSPLRTRILWDVSKPQNSAASWKWMGPQLDLLSSIMFVGQGELLMIWEGDWTWIEVTSGMP